MPVIVIWNQSRNVLKRHRVVLYGGDLAETPVIMYTETASSGVSR